MNKFQLLVVASMLLCLGLKGQNERFYTPSDGLSGTSIHGIFQDSRGYVWISLFSSLNRFDGYSFTLFEHREKDTTSINSTYTNVVFEDAGKRLWIGTDKGLNLFDYDRNCFQEIRLTEGKEGIVLNVKWILEDQNHSLWLATSHGLINYDPEKKHYDYYNHRFQSDGKPSYVDYNQAIADKKGNIWIGTGNEGVLLFDVAKHQFSTIREYTGTSYNFPDRTVMAVHQTKTGQILFGTAREGLVVYDPANGSFTQTKNSAGNENRLDRGIYSIITDQKGVIWLGTEGNGIKTYNLSNNAITDVSHLIDVPGASKSRIYCYEDRQGDMWFGIQERRIYVKIFSSKNFHAIGNSNKGEQLSHYLVSSMLIDQKGNFWIGTDGGGINLLKKGGLHFSIFSKSSNGVEIKDKAITKLYEDKRGWVWIGTYYEGLYCYQGDNKPLIHYHIPGYETDAKRDYVLEMIEDAKGNLWVGTKGGLFYFDVANGRLSDSSNPFVSGKTESINPNIYALAYDADSTLWIATEQGLVGWNAKNERFRSFQTSKGELKNDLVTCLELDRENHLWVGTLSGLYRYLPEKSILQRYAEEEGLCSSSIKAIETDATNRLWISTTAGIAKYDSKAAVFTNYFVADGLPCDKYVIGSSYQDSKGNLYFGGVDGLVHFHPDSIFDNQKNPNLIFTSFKVFNQEVRYHPNNPVNILRKEINATDTILINYSNKSFTIEFAAINFSAPEKIKYAVKMEGFDPNWQYKDSKHRYATYTNLAPGTYCFNVKSTNLEGLWPGSERRLCIIVTPPFWLTWWAFLCYLLILLLLIYYLRKIAIFRINMKNQLHLEHVEREKLEEINQSKMQFFTNVSHEIRTPLTMVLAPLERLLASDLLPVQKKNLNYVYKNTKRIERIVNQLLELQKIENTQLRVKARKIDLVKFLHEIISLFEGTAKDQKIHLSFEPNCEELIVWIDPEKMDKVIFNLISNALKFTPMEGLVTVTLSTSRTANTDGHFTISVSDTGSGMDQIHLDRIFDRFYQIENITPGHTIGFGIGLHLSKELVEKQHGTITVTSQENFGSTFVITMPLGKQHLATEEIYPEQPAHPAYAHGGTTGILAPQLPTPEMEREEYNDAAKKLILLVEDDMDILNYLEDELSLDYRIIKANNGSDGWTLAFDKTPHLIVSDIMMPGIDGLELCKKVKSTIETSHIPVILLTARTTVEQEIEGLETGADEYVYKPFHPRLLKLKVDKIIEARELLKQQFTKNTSFVAREMTVTSADERFLQKAIDFVKENLSDVDLNIEKMSSILNISRVHLYRKLKALTNQNPTEFVRTIRLKQAAYLLTQGKLNVSEIAYLVGFNSHQYFTNSFQKYFGMSPTEFIRKTETGG
jgi:signal transduction histidine kinase/ligand-binding sensor domain-containing protein/AraC-like DNA-binding protein/CheY-like chemotaxis protein